MATRKTNEENRVPLYDVEFPPTEPALVTSETPLSSLNLNWAERDLPERMRTKHVHRLHPYLGKYIPQIVEVFLRKYFTPGQTILDPFAGSGTSLVQANELGINSVGYDISAFNVLLCRAKTAEYDFDHLKREIEDILKRVERDTSTSWTDLPLFAGLAVSDSIEMDDEYLHTWFAPRALNELMTYRRWIDQGEYQYADLLKVILSRSARSARLTTHFDLDFPKKPQTTPYWCYKHSRTCAPTTEALKFLQRYSADTLKRVKEFAALRTTARVDVFNVDSRIGGDIPVDGVITSPPYVGLIDYHEQHNYAYRLLGMIDQRSLEIGAAAEGSSKRAQKQYQNDIAAVFKRALEIMPIGGRMIVIAGDRSNLYEGIAKMIDVEVEDVLTRHVNRRTGRRSGEFYESVFIWRKRHGGSASVENSGSDHHSHPNGTGDE